MKTVFRLLLLIILVLALVAGFIFLRPSTILSRQEVKAKYTLPASHFLTWRGGDVHYVDEGQGFPILMIHGLAGSHRNFGKIAAMLQDSFRCIRVDLPGFGLSDMPQVADGNYRQLYFDFLNFFLDTLNLDSFYLMGNSMGGWIAWELAVEKPQQVKKLVLLCSAGYDMEKIAERLGARMTSSSWLTEIVAARGVPLFITRANVVRCFADPTRIDAQEVIIANDFANRENNFRTILELLRHRQNADTSLIKNIRCPTLIVWGKQDRIIPVDHAYRFQRDIPRNKLIIYDDCGHIPMLEKTEQFYQDFLAFAADTSL
ncbi:MAG: hydrolase [Chitinophagales bacterium]|nr:MAG: hydrolase [Chitinophagales bacterium]